MGMTVGNFKHVKHLTFERVFKTRKCRMMTVGSLASPGVLTRLLGCSSARKACTLTSAMRTKRSSVAISKGRVGVCTGTGTTRLP